MNRTSRLLTTHPLLCIILIMGSCYSTSVATPEPKGSTTSTNPNPVVEKTLDEAEKEVTIAKKDRACFGAGCYWGTEKFFYYDFGKKNTSGAITDGAVGFMGPEDAPVDPTYAEVKGGYTRHVEVYEFEYSGGLAYYEALVRFFFEMHDPTTLKRQGNDVGTQYASVIFCYTDEQVAIATKVKTELQLALDAGKLECYENRIVTTDIRKATVFYPAHKEHQDYLTVNPSGYCNHRIRFKEWPSTEQAETVSATETVSANDTTAAVGGETTSASANKPTEQ